MADQPKEDKWPWTVSSREYGRLEQEVAHLNHRIRNMKMVDDGLLQEIHDLEKAVNDLSDSMIQLRTRIKTGAAVIAALCGVLAWVVDTAISINK